MKAVKWFGIRDLRMVDVENPEPRAHEALVRIESVGVCGSDLHYFEEGRIGGTHITEPLTLGHEYAGTIEEVGSEADPGLVGRRVAVEPGIPCGTCEWCRTGHYNVCESMVFPGGPPYDGVLCEYVAVHAGFCFPVPEGMSAPVAAAIEPVAVAIHTIELAQIMPGESVAILGLGPIGLLSAQVAKLSGAGRVYGTDLKDYRVASGLRHGVDVAVNASRDDTVDTILRETGGRGVDVAIDVARSSDTPGLACKVVRPAGRCVFTGIFRGGKRFAPGEHCAAQGARRSLVPPVLPHVSSRYRPRCLGPNRRGIADNPFISPREDARRLCVGVEFRGQCLEGVHRLLTRSWAHTNRERGQSSMLKKIVIGFVIGLVVVVVLVGGAVVIFVGPWPTYASGFEGKGYYTRALAAIDENAEESNVTATPGRLRVGWGRCSITPQKSGVPLAGYSARHGAPSTGVHDEVYVKALAASDGVDTVVLVGADLLIVPENVAELARAAVAERTPLTANDVYFGASHSHSSVGAFGPGLAGKMTGGEYDPEIPPFLAQAMADAVVEAFEGLEPARLAHGGVDAPGYIRNRTRQAPVDSEASYLVAEQDDGDRCYLVSYSAHPTILGSRNMEYSAEYPGYLQRRIETETGAFAMYLGGALGSMGPSAPPGDDDFARAQAMGEGLAKLVLEDAAKAEFKDSVDVASVGVPLELPPFQVRVSSTKWRLSKFLPPLLGIDGDGWIHGARLGDVVFIGLPCDFSGEISAAWKAGAEKQGRDLWTTSFCADYAGYVSPDKYYMDIREEDGDLAYETGMMSWTGPHQEAYFAALKDRIVAALTTPVL